MLKWFLKNFWIIIGLMFIALFSFDIVRDYRKGNIGFMIGDIIFLIIWILLTWYEAHKLYGKS